MDEESKKQVLHEQKTHKQNKDCACSRQHCCCERSHWTQSLPFCKTSFCITQQIIHEDLHFCPFEVQTMHTLNYDHAHCFKFFFVNFCNFWKDKITHSQNFEWWGPLSPSRYEHKQNYSCWSDSNTDELHEEPLHSIKVAVWCAVLPFRIMGPYLYEDNSGSVLTVMAGCCVRMIETFSPYNWRVILKLVKEHGFNSSEWPAIPQEYPWTLWNICFLIVSSLEMGIFHGLRDRSILEHAVSSCGAI